MDKTFSKYPIVCTPGCNYCCTTRLWVTSIEAEYLFKGLKENEEFSFDSLTYPRPKLTHNQTALLYFQGEETPPMEEEVQISSCPLLTKEGLCGVYERRPVICRVLLSLKKCTPESPAEYSSELYLMGLLALQIVENIDIGGLYGNLFDLLQYYQRLRKGEEAEIPPYLLSTVLFDELPLLPSEKKLRAWVSKLYRRKVEEGLTFKDLLDQIKEEYNKQKRLSFLEDLWGT